MKLTDERVIKMLKKARLYEVEESIRTYPEDEVDGRSDLEMVVDETGYIFSLYTDDTVLRDDLLYAKRKLTETKYGKVIPLDPRTLKPKPGYTPFDIQNCKDVVNEFARLQRFVKRLAKMGYSI